MTDDAMMFGRSFARNALCVLAFGFFYAVNPAWLAGCVGEEEPDFEYDESDMLSLIDVVNATTYDYDDGGAHYRVSVQLEQATEGEATAALVRTTGPSLLSAKARACGNRTFFKSAAACDSVSTMPLVGTLRVERVLDSGTETLVMADVSGELWIASRLLSGARFELSFDAGSIALDTEDGATFRVDLIDGEAFDS